MQVNQGFDPTNVLAINLNLPSSKYPNGAQQTAVLKQILERGFGSAWRARRRIDFVAAIHWAPATDFEIEGRAPVPDSQAPLADIRIVDAGYFRALSIPLRTGRTFTERDTADAPRVMLINEENGAAALAESKSMSASA